MSHMRDNVVVHIDTMLRQLPSASSSNPNIFKVNQRLRQVNEKAYDPVLVAIGPVHRNKDNLKHMELHKMMYLQQLLETRQETSVERYVVELRKCEKMAIQFYENSIQLPENDKFTEMLLLDGIFMIELLRKYHFPKLRRKDDNIFRLTYMFVQIQHDLLLIENQLPFFVLNQLFSMIMPEQPLNSLQNLFLSMMGGLARWMRPNVDSQIRQYHVYDHLAELFYKSSFSSELIDSRYTPNDYNLEDIKTISELNEAGIQFEPSHDCSNWTDASFKDGVLKLPLLQLYDYTELVLRNLIAYEQMLPSEYPRPMTNYSALMQSLIHSGKDVEILRRAGIIKTWLGDDETAHAMINKLGKNIMLSNNFSYLDVIKDVNEYCLRRRKRWMVILKRNYCNSPWAILSFIAATILLVLTFIQTLFSGLLL